MSRLAGHVRGLSASQSSGRAIRNRKETEQQSQNQQAGTGTGAASDLARVSPQQAAAATASTLNGPQHGSKSDHRRGCLFPHSTAAGRHPYRALTPSQNSQKEGLISRESRLTRSFGLCVGSLDWCCDEMCFACSYHLAGAHLFVIRSETKLANMPLLLPFTIL